MAGRECSARKLTFKPSCEERPKRGRFSFCLKVSGDCLRLSLKGRIHSAVSAQTTPTADEILRASHTARVPSQMSPKHIFLLSNGTMSFYLAAAEETGERRVRVAEAKVEDVGIVSSSILELGLDGLGASVAELLAGEGANAAILAIDYVGKLRIRVNGKGKYHDGRLHLGVEESFGNCNLYISRPESDLVAREAFARVNPPVKEGRKLAASERERVQGAQRFILATASARGADVSHRGGEAGFVQARETELMFPDYPGNNMFATVGNLLEDGRCALLFPALGEGRSLQIAGRAQVEMHSPNGEDLDTGRSIRVAIEHFIEE